MGKLPIVNQEFIPKYILKLLCFITLLLLAPPAVVRAQFTFTTNHDGSLNIYEYTGSGGEVTIPDTTNGLPITSIGEEAFYQDFTLTNVTIGANVTSIGENAFFQCSSLSSVTIPGSVTNIGEGPFWDCQGLTAISLGASNSYYIITNGVLCNKSQTVLIQYPGGLGGSYTIPASVTNVGEAFIGNTLTVISASSANLYYSSTNGVLCNKNRAALIEYPGGLAGSYTIPRTVTTIASAAFEYSASVAGVTIGTNVTSIGEYAFYDCTSLIGISVDPTNLYYSSTNGVLFNKTQTMLIQYPSGLGGSYTIPGTITNVGNGAFGDTFGLTGVVIPNSVLSIGEEAFYYCDSLTNLTIGDRVSSIGENAFYYCASLTGVVIPNSVTNIGEYAFYYCPSLGSAIIGSGVASIAEEAFAGCQSLTNVCFEGNEPSDGGSIFYYDYSLSAISYVNGTAGWEATYDGVPTAPCAECAGGAPQLAIIASGTNVILTWSANFTGFTLQSTTNLVSPTVWTTVSPAPVIINGNNAVTNSISSTSTFYRLVSP